MRYSQTPHPSRGRSARRANDPVPRGARWVKTCADGHPEPAARDAYYWLLARTQAEIDLAQKVRCQALVFESEIPVKGRRVPREVSEFDLAETSKHVIAFRGNEAVGALRVALPNWEFAAALDRDFGFEDEDSFDLSSLLPLRHGLAEVARVALLQRYRKGVAFSKLLAGLVVTARETRRRWLFGTVDCCTYRRDDGELLYQVARARGLVDPDHAVTGRWEGVDGDEVSPELGGVGFYSDEERTRGAKGQYDDLRLTPAIQTFVGALGARVVGRPARHAHFEGRLVLPMLADLTKLPPATRAVFGRHPAGLRPATPSFTKPF